MVSRVQLTPRARQDLRDIFRFTAREWSVKQAKADLEELDAAIRGLGTGQTRSSPVVDQIPGFQRARMRSHVLIHRRIGDRIEVVRILHASMDVARHL